MARERSKAVLTRLELEVMRGVWGTEPGRGLTVREVADRVNVGRRKGLAYNTVQTVLNILRDKGAVRVKAGDGRAHLYLPRVSRERVTTMRRPNSGRTSNQRRCPRNPTTAPTMSSAGRPSRARSRMSPSVPSTVSCRGVVGS